MKRIKAIVSSLIAILLFVILNTKLGDIPPLAKFLDPFHGFWKNAECKTKSKVDYLKLDGLKDSVEIQFDEQMIPHIFAQNNHDLYYAQGYITAKDRLWQMDFQTRYAAGRLSEIVGAKAIELDRYQHRMGMVYGANNTLQQMEKDPQIKEMMYAYTAGINAYIHSLKPKDYPIEFKILDYKPEDWKPLNSALLLKLMSATLTAGSDEFYMSNILTKYGPDVVKELFPDYPFGQDPIIPTDTKWNFKTLEISKQPIPTVSKTGYNQITPQIEEGIGSNNWALSGAKTASGYPMLANDPHLNLSLPSIWYQIQTVSNDVNAYGVSLPGSPGVVIGFNADVAWGVTNVAADVLDFYEIKFKDHTKKEYWYDNKWNPVKPHIENIAVRGGKTIIDTVYYTHHGPIVYLDNQKPKKAAEIDNIPTGHALRWIAHDSSNDIRTFYMLNRAKNYSDYRQALHYYTAPAQNFIFASINNDIAITANGYFPLKWQQQGKFLLDGTNPANDWHGRIPADQNPTVKNPPRNFVSSANQWPTNTTYPYYLNWEFAGYERGHRINKRLTVMTQATVDSLRQLQNDNYSILAENILPTLINAIDVKNLNTTERKSFDLVSQWDKYYHANAPAASIFEIWRKDISTKTWDDKFNSRTMPMRYPTQDKTVELLLKEPNSKWFDDSRTLTKETRDDVIRAAFKFAVDSLQRKYGALGTAWRWGNVKHTHVPHLAKIAGFGSKFLDIGGSKTSVNAMSESNGPSWRMVVALGEVVKAYGVFPGGESGNPGSFYYDDMVDTWSMGKLNELVYLRSKDEASKQIITKWIVHAK